MQKNHTHSFDTLTEVAFRILERGPQRLVKLLMLFAGLLVAISVLL